MEPTPHNTASPIRMSIGVIGACLVGVFSWLWTIVEDARSCIHPHKEHRP